MDDVDAVQAQIARNMLESGDWVTARLNGVAYLEKSPLIYWLMAGSYGLFGVSDWAARIPVALSAVLLAWVTAMFGAWAFGRTAGFYSGLVIATCVGLFLFTRIQIPDVTLTLAVTLAMWSFLRVQEDGEPHPGWWALVFWVCLGTGLLLKGLIAIVFPMAGVLLYLLVNRPLFAWKIVRRMRPAAGLVLMLAIAAPWYVLATLRNPPYFDFTLSSGPGQYRGFFWFYFVNEHLLRFLNLRYPRDYNTVPRLWFWLFHLLWLFPWSMFLAGVFRLKYRASDRASRTRLLAACWALFLLLFFTFSTTQEYYSMPAYPALALLLGSAIAANGALVRWGARAAGAIAAAACIAIAFILWAVRDVAVSGDISSALRQNPELYTLSLGHMLDLTGLSFAYLRTPLSLALVACAVGAAAFWLKPSRALIALALMMALFFHAARSALVVFDPYLGSRTLAAALLDVPEGELIVDDQYYAFSSVFFYANRRALLLNGRKVNLEYGSYAPGAPNVFIDDGEFARRWRSPERYYAVFNGPERARFERLTGGAMFIVKESGGKFLASNRPLAAARSVGPQ